MNDQMIDDERGTRQPQGRVKVPPALWYLTASQENRISSYYELIEREFRTDLHLRLVGRKTQYLNYGYWAPGCSDYDEACEALADELGEAAGITAGDHVLDVGFGYAEQDFRWLETRKPARIVGINVTPNQVHAARRRAAEMNLGDRLELRLGSATSTPFPNGSFDRVVALESALHFDTRRKFFDEAFRVLRPGGVLATADVLPRELPNGRKTLAERFDEWCRKRVIPADNWHSRDVYAERLERAGFTDVDVQNVNDKVYEPNTEYMRKRCADALRDPRFKSFSRQQTIKWYLKTTELRAALSDYVIAVAKKPCENRRCDTAEG